MGAQSCDSSADCPSTHECTGANCCPSKCSWPQSWPRRAKLVSVMTDTICNQPKVVGGSCNNYAIRFWYNPATGSCEQFYYSG